MRSRQTLPLSFLFVVAITVSLTPQALAGTENVLHSFCTTDGDLPYAGVIFDQAGNLYGTTFYGGSQDCGHNGCGVVFKLSPNGNGTWSEQAIYTFTGGTDGSHPYSTLVFDAAGNLYGTTYGNYYGGTGVGTAFRLTPGADGAWQFSLLHTFSGGKDGARPYGMLAIDKSGNLYGSADIGGSHNAGIAFELSPASGDWTETLLHTFTGGKDGSAPIGLLLSPSGNLFGAAAQGGLGTVRFSSFRWVRMEPGARVSCIARAVARRDRFHPAWRSTLPETFTRRQLAEGPVRTALPGADWSSG